MCLQAGQGQAMPTNTALGSLVTIRLYQLSRWGKASQELSAARKASGYHHCCMLMHKALTAALQCSSASSHCLSPDDKCPMQPANQSLQVSQQGCQHRPSGDLLHYREHTGLVIAQGGHFQG